MSGILDLEKPDLVVFSGDQLNGQGTSWDPKSVLAKFAVEVTDRKIPWAAVFGNHDDGDGDAKAEQMRMMEALPYSLVERGPKDIHGVGNYVLKVRSADQCVVSVGKGWTCKLMLNRQINDTVAHVILYGFWSVLDGVFGIEISIQGYNKR